MNMHSATSPWVYEQCKGEVSRGIKKWAFATGLDEIGQFTTAEISRTRVCTAHHSEGEWAESCTTLPTDDVYQLSSSPDGTGNKRK